MPMIRFPETLERLREGKVTRAFRFTNPIIPKSGAGVVRWIVITRLFQEHLKMAIAFRLLPQSMNWERRISQ
jgi:hypothetical protein